MRLSAESAESKIDRVEMRSAEISRRTVERQLSTVEGCSQGEEDKIKLQRAGIKRSLEGPQAGGPHRPADHRDRKSVV